jgi:hypothetical protein
MPEAPDVVAEIPGVYIEVKRRERLNLYAWMREVYESCGDEAPLLLYRRNNQPWVAIILADDLPKVAAALAKKGT